MLGARRVEAVDADAARGEAGGGAVEARPCGGVGREGGGDVVGELAEARGLEERRVVRGRVDVGQEAARAGFGEREAVGIPRAEVERADDAARAEVLAKGAHGGVENAARGGGGLRALADGEPSDEPGRLAVGQAHGAVPERGAAGERFAVGAGRDEKARAARGAPRRDEVPGEGVEARIAGGDFERSGHRAWRRMGPGNGVQRQQGAPARRSASLAQVLQVKSGV